MNTRLSNTILSQIWKTYQNEFLSGTAGTIWIILSSALLSRFTPQGRLILTGENFEFDPTKHLTHHQQLVWRLHAYLANVIQRHRFIVTQRGYMGVAPPDTAPGDVVVVLGGPGTAYLVTDLPITMYAQLETLPHSNMLEPVTGAHTTNVESAKRLPVSELRGPCHIWGTMDGEMYS